MSEKSAPTSSVPPSPAGDRLEQSSLPPGSSEVANRNGRRTRVLQVNYRHTFGGSEKLAATIGTSLDPDRFECLFAAMKGDGEVGEMLRDRGYSTVFFGRREGFDPMALWRVWRYLRRTPIDIVQTHHVGSLVYCAPPARALGMKVVHTEHDIHSFERLPNEMRWIRRLVTLPHKYIAIDPTIGDFLKHEVRVPEEKIHVIRNGIDLAEFRPREPRDLNGDRPFVFGWVSRLVAPKRPDVFVDALAILAKDDPLVRGRIIGGGEQVDKLNEQIRNLGLGDRIEMLGPRDDIADQLRELDAYILCSEREGLPISLVEAMATELPTVVSAVGGIPALVEHQRNGLLLEGFEPAALAEQMKAIQHEQGLALRIGRQARQDARERFDLANTIKQYMEVFDQVMRGA